MYLPCIIECHDITSQIIIHIKYFCLNNRSTQTKLLTQGNTTKVFYMIIEDNWLSILTHKEYIIIVISCKVSNFYKSCWSTIYCIYEISFFQEIRSSIYIFEEFYISITFHENNILSLIVIVIKHLIGKNIICI